MSTNYISKRCQFIGLLGDTHLFPLSHALVSTLAHHVWEKKNLIRFYSKFENIKNCCSKCKYPTTMQGDSIECPKHDILLHAIMDLSSLWNFLLLQIIEIFQLGFVWGFGSTLPQIRLGVTLKIWFRCFLGMHVASTISHTKHISREDLSQN